MSGCQLPPHQHGSRRASTLGYQASAYACPSGSTPKDTRAIDFLCDALPGRISTGCVFTPRYPVK